MASPHRPGKPTRLKITDDKGFEKVVLIDRDPFPIGRDVSAGLCLPGEAGPSVAARHASIIQEAGRFVLRDEAGARGTRVNGRPVRQMMLRHGDEITLGASPLKIQFLVEGSRAADVEEGRIHLLLGLLRDLHARLETEEVATRSVAAVMRMLAPDWVALSIPIEGGLRIVAAADKAGHLPTAPTRLASEVNASGRSAFQPNRLCVPIDCGRQVLAVFDVGPHAGRPYTPDDLTLLESLAAHTGVALGHCPDLDQCSRAESAGSASQVETVS
ncbi:MAG TPA: FHA domain-containing protein [Candidatus Polarisedimenticolia bacterium]|nr:FHA domain-containing protein [Candidatus Polarisedimenticolia bacterium]